MTFHQPFRVRLPAWADWFALILMSIAAPVIAACIHSIWVFHRGFRLYNAEIGGAYFHQNIGQTGLLGILFFIGFCGIPAIPTFLILLPFRRRTFYRWIVWSAFIFLWTWLFFKMEIAFN